MDEREDGGQRAFEDQSRMAGEMLERSLMKAVSSVEAELARVVRSGEADLDRLVRRMTEALAQLAADGALRDDAAGQRQDPGDAAASLNGIATAIARAARRGMRFT